MTPREARIAARFQRREARRQVRIEARRAERRRWREERRAQRASLFSRLVIYPYKAGSRSAKLLAEKLTRLLGSTVRRIKPDGKYRPGVRSLVLNYGSSQVSPVLHQLGNGQFINTPGACRTAGNKLSAFGVFSRSGIRIPEYTEDIAVAQRWRAEGEIVLCRTSLTGHSGYGIVIADEANAVINAPLYVKYKKKRKEFRVHVFNGEVIDLAEKRRIRKELREDGFHGLIRNHANGWVFCRTDIVEPSGLRTLAVQAVNVLGLSFGACDIIWNEKENQLYVLEVNTAPGIEGTTLERYAQAIQNFVQTH